MSGKDFDLAMLTLKVHRYFNVTAPQYSYPTVTLALYFSLSLFLFLHVLFISFQFTSPYVVFANCFLWSLLLLHPPPPRILYHVDFSWMLFINLHPNLSFLFSCTNTVSLLQDKLSTTGCNLTFRTIEEKLRLIR